MCESPTPTPEAHQKYGAKIETVTLPPHSAIATLYENGLVLYGPWPEGTPFKSLSFGPDGLAILRNLLDAPQQEPVAVAWMREALFDGVWISGPVTTDPNRMYPADEFMGRKARTVPLYRDLPPTQPVAADIRGTAAKLIHRAGVCEDEDMRQFLVRMAQACDHHAADLGYYRALPPGEPAAQEQERAPGHAEYLRLLAKRIRIGSGADLVDATELEKIARDLAAGESTPTIPCGCSESVKCFVHAFNAEPTSEPSATVYSCPCGVGPEPCPGADGRPLCAPASEPAAVPDVPPREGVYVDDLDWTRDNDDD